MLQRKRDKCRLNIRQVSKGKVRKSYENYIFILFIFFSVLFLCFMTPFCRLWVFLSVSVFQNLKNLSDDKKCHKNVRNYSMFYKWTSVFVCKLLCRCRCWWLRWFFVVELNSITELGGELEKNFNLWICLWFISTRMSRKNDFFFGSYSISER